MKIIKILSCRKLIEAASKWRYFLLFQQKMIRKYLVMSKRNLIRVSNIFSFEFGGLQ